MSKILLAGGTGTVGREAVKHLLERGLQPRVLTREPDKVRSRVGASVEVAFGNLMDPSSLPAAFRDVEVAYIATTPGPELAEQEGNFIAAARAAKLHRVVKLSAFGVGQATDQIHREHVRSERRLEESGLAYVILRPVMFMSNLSWEAASIKAGRIESIFGDGRMSFVDPNDVAAMAVRALTAVDIQSSEWEFGGPQPLSYDDVAATFSRALGRKVEHVRLDEATFRRDAPLPALVVEAIAESAAMARRGKYEITDELIQRELGRRANSLESWIDAHRAAFSV